MPELPEVEAAARLLRRAARGRVIGRVRLLHPSLARRVSARELGTLAGRRVTAVERRGKHQLLRLDDGRAVHVHFRMTGDWITGRSQEPLPRFARAVIDFADGTRVVLDDSRALATVAIAGADEDPLTGLAPDATSRAMTPAAFARALSTRRAPIKSALLDQRVVAGVGNIYAAEALWRARIDPRRGASSLTRVESDRLIAALRLVLRRASGARYRGGGGPLDVYDREGLKCRRCRGAIERIVQAGRSTYFCPRCQPPLSPSPRAGRP